MTKNINCHKTKQNPQIFGSVFYLDLDGQILIS